MTVRKKKEAARKTSTLKRKPACSLQTGAQQALFPHENLEHLQIPTESTLWFAAPSHDVLADALLKAEPQPRDLCRDEATAATAMRTNSCSWRQWHRRHLMRPRCAAEAALAHGPTVLVQSQKKETTKQKWAHLRQTPSHAQLLCCLQRHVWLW